MKLTTLDKNLTNYLTPMMLNKDRQSHVLFRGLNINQCDNGVFNVSVYVVSTSHFDTTGIEHKICFISRSIDPCGTRCDAIGRVLNNYYEYTITALYGSELQKLILKSLNGELF